MSSFPLTFRRLLVGLRAALDHEAFRAVFVALLLLLISGAVFCSTVEGLKAVGALYFSVVTLATVGYGDLSPKPTTGRTFTIVYIFVSIAQRVAACPHQVRPASVLIAGELQ